MNGSVQFKMVIIICTYSGKSICFQPGTLSEVFPLSPLTLSFVWSPSLLLLLLLLFRSILVKPVSHVRTLFRTPTSCKQPHSSATNTSDKNRVQIRRYLKDKPCPWTYDPHKYWHVVIHSLVSPTYSQLTKLAMFTGLESSVSIYLLVSQSFRWCVNVIGQLTCY